MIPHFFGNHMRIFISYGRDEHIALAKRLKEDLKARGHEVWFDEDRLKEGGDWEQYIEDGLNWCAEVSGQGRVILLMTPHSVRRPGGYCLNEITAAILHGLDIIPVMVVWCKPPLSIIRIQWLDMRDCVPLAERQERYNLKWGRLIEALEQGKIDFEGTQARLLHDLKPLDFAADLAKHVTHFTGREWVFKEIESWLANPEASRIFWITGDPGVGKTAIAAYLCERRDDVVAHHFCIHGDDLKADPRHCVMSLAYNLAMQLPEYEKRLLDLLGDLNQSARTLFDHLIVQPLSYQSQVPNRPLLIVVDGLDEATRHGKNELAHLLSERFPYAPNWLRLVITSRPDPEVVGPLQKLSPYYLDAGLPENLEDIRNYLGHNLPLVFPSVPMNEQIIEIILRKSEGVFLYVEQVLAELKQGRLTLERLEDFPQGLGEFFWRAFVRQFPDAAVYKKRHRPLLEMILAARGPLPLNLAQAALSWGSYDFRVGDRGEVGGEAIAPLGSLFPREAGHIRTFHRSLIDWLTAHSKSGDYFVDVRQGQSRMAEICWNEYRAGLEKMSPYTMAHLPTHLMETARWEDLLELITRRELGLITRWIEEGEGDRGLACLTGLIHYLQKNKRQPVMVAGLATQAARIHSLWGEYDKAQEWLEEALARTSWWRGRRVAAIALHEMGSLALYRNEFEHAGLFYRKALRRCQRGYPIYHDEAAANLIGLATLAHVVDRFLETLRFATLARREAERAGDLRHLVAAERLLGAAYKSLGGYQEANSHLQAAAGLSIHVPLEKPRILLLQGWLQYDWATLAKQAPDQAIPLFEEALNAAQKVGDFYCLSEARLSLGWCALASLTPNEAARWFSSLKETLPLDRHLELYAMLRLGLAEVAHLRGELDGAGELYKEVERFCRSKAVSIWHWRALIGLGAICWHAGRPAEGEKYWEEALDVAGQISDGKIALAKASIELCRGDPNVPPR
jgi:tetratricopeptide (TPR) repeat protein